MKQFLNLNKHKIKFAFLFTSAIFTGFALTVLTISYFKNVFPISSLLLAIFFFSALVLPSFIICLAYLGWYYRLIVRSKAFSKAPFSQLNEIGFSDCFLNENSKWHFTEKIKTSITNGYRLYCDVSKEKSHVIEFNSYVSWSNPNNIKFQEVSKKLKYANIEAGFGTLSKIYDQRKTSAKNIYDIKNDLEEFTELMKQEGFNPNQTGY